MAKQKIPCLVFFGDASDDGTLVQVSLTAETPYLIDFVDDEFVVK